MAQFPRKTRRYFEACGRRGGKARARRLLPAVRSAIASRAAKVRWEKGSSTSLEMPSVRLASPRFDDPSYIEEVLTEGSIEDWKNLYQKIADHPFGDIAQALERVLSAIKVYGVTPLWRGLLRAVRAE